MAVAARNQATECERALNHMAKNNSNSYKNAVAYVGSLRLMERANLLAVLRSGILEAKLKELPADECLGGTHSLSVLEPHRYAG